MKQKGRNFWVVSVLHPNPEVPLLLEVLDSNEVNSEAIFEEEEVLHREDRDRFPLVEEDMVLEEDLEAIL